MSATQFAEFAKVNGLRWKTVKAEDDRVREYVKWARLLPRLGMWSPAPGQTLLMDDGRAKVAKPTDPEKVWGP